MSVANDPKAGQVHTALATWLYLLADAGHPPRDGALAAAIQALRSATAGRADPLGQALVDAVRAALGTEPVLAAVTAWLTALYGAEHVTTDLGADREARVHAARRHQFSSNLPWLARVYDRFPDGTVGPHWLLVERVDERVVCLDPYPWDELDEEYAQPLIEFLVKWELAGCEGLRFQP